MLWDNTSKKVGTSEWGCPGLALEGLGFDLRRKRKGPSMRRQWPVGNPSGREPGRAIQFRPRGLRLCQFHIPQKAWGVGCCCRSGDTFWRGAATWGGGGGVEREKPKSWADGHDLGGHGWVCPDVARGGEVPELGWLVGSESLAQHWLSHRSELGPG